MFSQKYTENIGNMWLIMINPQKPVINLIKFFLRFTALYINIYITFIYRVVNKSEQLNISNSNDKCWVKSEESKAYVLYVYIYIDIYILHVNIYSVYIYANTYMWLYIYVNTYFYIYIYISVNIYIYMNIYIYIYICEYIHVNIYIYVYIGRNI